MIKKIKNNYILVICLIIFSISLTTKTLQNDTFYSIAIGKHISECGIDNADAFSWHNLAYTYPHWLYDLGISVLYNLAGMNGIYLSTIILSCILGITIYFVGRKITKNEITSFVSTIATMVILRAFITARAQLVTFILFTLQVLFIELFIQSDTNKSKVLNVIALFAIGVFIANIHTAVWPFFFVLFMPYIGEYIVSVLVPEKIETILERIVLSRNNNQKFLILVMIICIFSGLLTPIGDAPYTYLYKTLIGNSTTYIQEHLPMVLSENIYAMIIFAIYFALLIFTKIKIRLKDMFMTIGLMILSLFSLRQFSIFVLIGGLSINLMFSNWWNEKSPQDYEFVLKKLTTKTGTIFIIIATILYSLIFFIYNGNRPYIDEILYPKKATKWLKQNLDVENIKLYNEYDFGSYLLYEGVPVFIDSRADLYTPEFNEGQDVFSDFFATSGLTVHYEDTFEKYNITHIMIYNDSMLSVFLSKDENYKAIYVDECVIIYERLEK